MDLLIAGLLFAGTALQMQTSVRDFKANRVEHLEWWNTEDELVEEIPAWKWIQRRRTRRELRSWRAPELHREIQHMTRVFISWICLWVGAVLVLVQAMFA